MSSNTHVPISLVQGARNVYMQQPTITMVTADGSERTRPQILAALRDNLLPRAQFAEYDAASPAPRNACTKNTRKAILDKLQVWASDNTTTKVYWLNGMAGTGKTTIAYSFSEILDEKNSLGGTFFSSRLRADTSDVRCIIPTISLQLAKYLPSVSRLILDVVETNPDCQYWRIGKQFLNFIFKPLTTAYRDAGEVVIVPVIILDALDECSDQSLVTELLSAILKHSASLPVKFFITSRPEVRLKECFDKSQAHSTFDLQSYEGSCYPPYGLRLLSATRSASNPNLPLTNTSTLPIRHSLTPAVGHFRRASSGSRPNHSAEVWGTLESQEHQGTTFPTPRRVNPYPSPDAPPRVNYDEMEMDLDLTPKNGGWNTGLGMADSGDTASAGFGEEVGLSGRGTYSGLDVTSTGAGGSWKAELFISNGPERSQLSRSNTGVAGTSQTDVLPFQIPNVNVTTGRTPNASQPQRKQDTNFVCTVPDCGATFTRGFNLKGHLRSHFEEKPYKCHWPGCGKGFARQHDCKRHEQLHSNFRPNDEMEVDLDLTLGNGGGNMGLGMADLGDTASAGFGEGVGLSGRGTYSGLDVTSAGSGGSQKAESLISTTNGREHSQTRQSRSNAGTTGTSQTDALPSEIPKINVTTGRTANASQPQRKKDANFVCTVPDCGATFTRGFNLKGHLRSHFEEKPYKCHWPGCGKGFARQHDCKRHEQLHSNFRPFECEGCRRQFAVMDALNRHLRSEAGVECARIVERGKGAGGGGADVWSGGMAL